MTNTDIASSESDEQMSDEAMMAVCCVLAGVRDHASEEEELFERFRTEGFTEEMARETWEWLQQLKRQVGGA